MLLPPSVAAATLRRATLILRPAHFAAGKLCMPFCAATLNVVMLFSFFALSYLFFSSFFSRATAARRSYSDPRTSPPVSFATVLIYIC
jgi:hypothetical protein